MAAVSRLLALAAILAAMAGDAMAAPRRIASLGVCADQYILGMVERDRIAALSRDAANPSLSLYHEAARGLPVTGGSAEELLALRPDLVVANRWGNTKTLAILERLGVPVLRLTLPATFEDVMAETRRVAAAFGETARGERLIADAEARIDAIARHAATKRPEAVYIMPGGHTAGRESFVNTVFAAAGVGNMAARLGKVGWTSLSLEELVAEDPDLLVFSFFRPGIHSLASRYRHHGLLIRLAARKPGFDMPERYWVCGGWFLHEAVARLAEELRR